MSAVDDLMAIAMVGSIIAAIVFMRPQRGRDAVAPRAADEPTLPHSDIADGSGWVPTASVARRVYAAGVDALCLSSLSFVVIALVPAFGEVVVLRVTLVVSWFASLMLYEPLLVSLRGGTLGHTALNLHVVDDRTGRPPTILRSCCRYALKFTLGLFSYISMIRPANDRTIHDLLTHSSVRIKDPARAKPYHYALEPE